jgi:hypothetical protein
MTAGTAERASPSPPALCQDARPAHRDGTMTARTTRVPSILAFCATLTLAGVAAAEPIPRPTNPEAIRYLEEGFGYYEAGEFERAIEVYRKAARIDPQPAVHFNLGQCFRRLRRYDEAIFHFERMLADRRVRSDVREHVEGLIRAMRAEMESAAASKPPTGPAESIEADPRTEDPMTSELTSVTPTVVASGASPATRWYHDRLGWWVSGSGAAVVLVGGALHLRGSARSGQADRETDQMEVARLRRSASTHRTWGTVALVAGGAALAGGIIRLALVPDSKDISVESAAVSVEVGPTWVGIVGRF